MPAKSGNGELNEETKEASAGQDGSSGVGNGCGRNRREENSKWAHLPSIELLFEKNGFVNGQFPQFGAVKEQNDDAEMDDEEFCDPNMEFVKQFDHFGSFARAAGYIEDWIRTKKHNATDFTNDLPAVINRGCLLRSILVKMR